MKALPLVLSILTALLFSNCATTGPTPQEMRSDIAGYTLPSLPKSGKAIVYVVRPAALGGFIPFKVFVDNKERGSAKGTTLGKQYIYFDVEPGTRKILSRAENTADISVVARPGDIIFIEQVPQPGLVVARNNVSRLDSDEGKYHVKRLKLGRLTKK